MKFKVTYARIHDNSVIKVQDYTVESNWEPIIGSVKIIFDEPLVEEVIISVQEIKCDHEWKESGYYIETVRYKYECPYSGETLAHIEGYTEWETLCTKCGIEK